MFDDDDRSKFGGEHWTFTEEDEEEEDIDFYVILSVPRDATTEEIHKAYKQRCLIFHPDKHLNLDIPDRKEADKIFAELQRAHKTLMDPCMRRIYDVMGVRGINLQGWQLVEHTSTAEDIRREYEFIRRLRDHEIMLQIINPISSFFTKFSLIGCFQEVDRYGPELLGMTLGQSVDCALVGSHKIGLGGETFFDKRRIGNGNLQLWHKWAYSIGIQQETTLTASPEMAQISTKITLADTSPESFFYRYSVTIEPMLTYSIPDSSISPSINASLIAPLLPGWEGICALNFPNNVSISLFSNSAHGRLKFLANLHLATTGFHYIRLVYNCFGADSKWTVRTRISMHGITPSLSYERQISKYSRIAFKLTLSYPSFLLLSSIRISTSVSSFEFCFVLCDNQEDVVRAFVKGIFIPFIAFNTARLIYRRMRGNEAIWPNQTDGD
uniref:J domain-containing protein n=1 Tax=Globodera pallida TaxID=36090 RepID=A0A183BMT1_GLOPA